MSVLSQSKRGFMCVCVHNRAELSEHVHTYSSFTVVWSVDEFVNCCFSSWFSLFSHREKSKWTPSEPKWVTNKPHKNIRSAYRPDVSGAGTTKVNTGSRCRVLDYQGTRRIYVCFTASCQPVQILARLPCCISGYKTSLQRTHGSWFRSRSQDKQTVRKFVWNRTKTRGDLSTVVLVCDCCVHICTNEPHQEGKQTSLI